MKKLIALILSFAILMTCMNVVAEEEFDLPELFVARGEADYTSIDDPGLLRYIEDSVYAYLESEYAGSDIIVDDVSAVYISKEYLEETSYNSRANVFFGYTLAQLDEAFEGRRYVFTCENRETVVREFEEFPDNTYERIIKNVAIGAGVILICVTVSVISGGLAAPTAAVATASAGSKISMIFAASATKATEFAVSGALFGGVTSTVVRGIETDWDFDETLRGLALGASDGFKWGAISGAVVGGAEKALKIHKISSGAIKPEEAEAHALSQYGGESQISYLNGERVPYGTPGSTRPDVVANKVAYEVKCYNLESKASLYELRKTLTKEISERVSNLPSDMTQKIVLNVEGRGYTEKYVKSVVKWIKRFIEPIYPDIPIDVIGGML